MKNKKFQNRRKFFKSISLSAVAGFFITKIPFGSNISGNTAESVKKPEVKIHPLAVKRKNKVH